jgi:hypothetical protein
MSQENVELHHRAIEAFNRRDLETWLELARMKGSSSSRSIWSWRAAPIGTTLGFAASGRTISPFSQTSPLRPMRSRDLGEVTLALFQLRGHGSGSDVPFEQPIWQVVRWRRQKCVSWHSFRNEAAALEAAGLSE